MGIGLGVVDSPKNKEDGYSHQSVIDVPTPSLSLLFSYSIIILSPAFVTLYVKKRQKKKSTLVIPAFWKAETKASKVQVQPGKFAILVTVCFDK